MRSERKTGVLAIAGFISALSALTVGLPGCGRVDEGGSHQSSRSTALISTGGFSQSRFEELEDLYRTTAGPSAWLDESGVPQGRVGKHSSTRGVLRAISGPGMALPVAGLPPGASPEQVARTFLVQWGDLFGLSDPAIELITKRITTGLTSEVFVRFDQVTPSGLPVFEHGLIVSLDDNNRVTGVSGLVLPNPPDEIPAITSQEASYTATINIGIPSMLVQPPELGVYDQECFDEPRGPARLAWRADLETEEPAVWRHYIDAETGEILFVYDKLKRHQREVYWLNHGTTLPGTLVWRNTPYYQRGDWPGTSWHIYEGINATADYLWYRHERDSWDNNQMPEYHRMRASSDYSSAGWSNGVWKDAPYWQAIYGDLAACTDIVAHEFIHGVDDTEAQLTEIGESGYLAESIADVFGQFVERYVSGDGPDWIVGTGDSCDQWRDLANPESPSCEGCKSGAAHYSNLHKWYGNDVHSNSLLLSKSAWLLGRETSLGPVTFAGITVTGIGEVDTGKVWYDALTNRLSYLSTLRDFREAIIDSAAWLFGVGENRYDQALYSVDAIGLLSYDYSESFDTGNRVALAVFTVSGQERRYIFYKEPVDTSPDLFYRYRTCVIYGGCSWSTASTLDFTGKGPAAVVFDNKLWVFYKSDVSNYIYYKTLNSSGSWSTTAQRPTGYPTTDSDVAATAYNGKLYLFYKIFGSGAKAIKYHTWTPGGVGWEGPFPAGGATSENGPAVAAPYNNVLTLVYVRGTTSPNLRYRSMDTTGTWTSETTPTDNLNFPWIGSPTAYLFKNRLHVAGIIYIAGVNRMVYRSLCAAGAGCTYGPGEWTWNVIQDQDAPRNFVTLFEDGHNHLYLFFRNGTANAINWRYKRSE